MNAWFRFVLSHRGLVLGGVLAVSLLSAASVSRAVVASSPGKMFFGESPEYEAYKARVRRFANDEFLVIAYGDPEPLSPASLDRLERIVERLGRLPDVGRIESLLGAKRLVRDGGVPRLEVYADAARRDPARAEEIAEALAADPLVGGLVLSEDRRHVAVVVELAIDTDRPAERAPEIVEEIVACFEAEGLPREALHEAGFPVLIAEVIDQTYYNLERILPIAALVLLAVVFALFRRVSPAAVSSGVALVAVLWTMGLATLIDPQLSIFASIIPAVILIVAFSDIIHMWNAYLTELEAGLPREEAILTSATEVGGACLYTSATTFIGFACMSLVPTPVFRQLGIVLGFGVGIALLLAMTLVPIVLSYLPTPPPRRAHGRDRLDRAIDAIARVSIGRPRVVIAAFAVVLAASLAGAARLRIETTFEERLDDDHPYRVDQRYLREHFAGTNVLEVFVDVASPADLTDPESMARVAAFQDEVAALPGVDAVVSLVDAVGILQAGLGGADRLPATREGWSLCLRLLDAGAGRDLARIVDRESGTLRLAVRLSGEGMIGTHEAGRRIAALGAERLGPDATVEVTGLTYLLGWWLDSVVEGQKNGLIVSLVTISIMMVVAVRSFRMGLWSMIPNALPLVAIGGWLGATWDQVDSDTFIIGMMAIGIGVDDTIHFLLRYRLERGRVADRAAALERTFRFAGRGIVMTTVILVLGFLPFAFSDYFSIRIMGTLLPVVLVIALAADLLLVPALVRVGWMDAGGPAAARTPARCEEVRLG